MEKIVFFKRPGCHQTETRLVESLSCIGDVLNEVENRDCYFMSNGKVIGSHTAPKPGAYYLICARLRGGKGGFGSMLRAIGAQIEKTTNREACRDLSGRRMRDVNNEKKMVEYLEKKAEQEREKEQKKMEKLERLTRTPKHFFNDPDYDSKLHEAVENVDEAVRKGIVVHSNKRKTEEKERCKEEPKLKKGLWLGEEGLSSSDSDDEEDAEMRIATTLQKSCSPDLPGTSSGSSDLETRGTSTPDSSGKEVENLGNVENDVSKPTIWSEEDGKVVPNSKLTEDIENENIVKNGMARSETEVAPGGTDDSGSSKCLETVDTKTVKGLPNGRTASNGDAVVVEADLSNYSSADDLQSLGLEVLKSLLMKKGMKCGGSLQERAERLYGVKDIPNDKIDPSLLASNVKKRNRSRK